MQYVKYNKVLLKPGKRDHRYQDDFRIFQKGSSTRK